MSRKSKLLFFTVLIIFLLNSCSTEQKEGGQNSIEFETEEESICDEGYETEHVFDTEKVVVLETEISESEVLESEVLESEVIEIEISKADIEVPDIEVSETEALEVEVSETEVSETEQSEVEISEAEVPELEVPQTEIPETEMPESEVPEISIPESEAPETEVPESEIPAPDIEVPEIDDGSHYIPIPEEWNLIVVNKWNKIPEGYTVELTELPNGQKIDSRLHDSLQEMFEAAKVRNINLFVREGYRTTEEQQKILDDRIQSYLSQGYSQSQAEKKAKEWVAVPGTSEHELGLAVDINADSKYGNNQTAYKWLKENAYKYGFILRYPDGKEEITGIAYEPWHYRYVGVEAAVEIYQSGICLEEYLQLR